MLLKVHLISHKAKQGHYSLPNELTCYILTSLIDIFHLFSYLGGMYALASHEEQDQNSARWMDIAKGITNTCHESYDR